MSDGEPIDLTLKGALAAGIRSSDFEAIDRVDAAFFSGDTFHSREALAFIAAHLERWFRRADEIDEILKEDE